MISCSFAPKQALLLFVATMAALTSTGAFQVSQSLPLLCRRQVGGLTLGQLSMTTEPVGEDRIGPTEQLLLHAKKRRDDQRRGYVQKIGKTVKRDHLDGVRAMVWWAYGVSNYMFGGLGALLFVTMTLNLAGYGFYIDTGGSFVVDTLEHIHQDQFFAAEASRLVADASEDIKIFL